MCVLSVPHTFVGVFRMAREFDPSLEARMVIIISYIGSVDVVCVLLQFTSFATVTYSR